MNAQIDTSREKLFLSHRNLKSGLFEFLFQSPSPSYLSKVVNFLILGATYLAGVFHWTWLLNFWKLDLKYMDWQKFFDYYGVIQKALAENTIPYFMPYFYKGTNQFLAIPETDLSPTIVLLRFLSVEDFFLAQFLILYSLGFIGCLLLKRRYQWSHFTFLFFFLVFNLNGHIVSHIAISHWPWISYFLFPFFIGWVFKLVEGDVSALHGTRLSWLLFGLLLLGGLHPFVWCLIFLLFLGLCQKRFWKPIMIGGGLAIIFSAYRILPAAVTFFGYKHNFLSGFPSASVFWRALTSVEGEGNVLSLSFGDNTALWWEVDHYIGIIGLVAMVYFGIILRLKEKNSWGINDYRVLNIPMLIVAVLSFGKIYGIFTLIPIPFISVERISARFFIVPLLILLMISCVWMQQMFNRLSANWSVMLLALTAILIQGFLFFEHSSIWQVKIWEAKFASLGIQMLDPISDWAKSVEGYYIPTVQISYLISLTAILAFVAGSLYLKRKGHAPYKEV